MSDVYTSADGWAFVQFEAGQDVYPLGSCYDLDALPDPAGDRDPIMCLDAQRDWQNRGWNRTPPDKITTTLTGLQAQARTWLERLKDEGYRFNLYITEGFCNTRSVFGSWQRAWILQDAVITDDSLSSALMRGPSAESERAFSISAMPRRIDVRTPAVTRIVSADTVSLNDVAAGNDWREKSDEGPAIYKNQNMIAACDAVGLAIPDVIITRDRWATHTSPATTFVADENVISVCRFRLDCDTVREVATRSTRVGVAMSVQYSDDDWATATEVVVGATLAEFTTMGGTIFALDKDHIWVCTDQGNVYFSSDAGVSFAVQPTAITADAGASMNHIHFADEFVGVCVGAGDVIIYTLDGGENWVAGTPTGTGDALLSVHVFDSQRWIVGTDGVGAANEMLQMTFDQSANWTTIDQYDQFPVNNTDDCFDVEFANELVGFALIGPPAGQVNVYQSIDGGWSWRRLTTPTNVQLNALSVIHPNLAYAVGELSTTSMILRIEG